MSGGINFGVRNDPIVNNLSVKTVNGSSKVFAPANANNTINTGVTPTGMAITPNGLYLYVANNNNYGIAGQDSVTVIDTFTLLPVTTIYDVSFNQPYTVTINAAGTKAYVTNSAGATVTVINTATNTVSNVISGFDGPSGFAINPLTNLAYVNNYGGPILGSGNGHTVSVVNLNTNVIVNTVNVGLAPAAIAITPDNMFVYTINYTTGNTNSGTVSKINTNNLGVTTIGPFSPNGFSGSFAIAINSAGTLAYITNFGSNNFTPFGNTVSVLNLSTGLITATITVGIQPSGIALSSEYAYVSNYNTLYAGSNFTNLTAGQGTLNIIDLATNTVLSPTITVGQSPGCVVLSTDGSTAFVSNFTSGTVSVVDVSNFPITYI